MNKTRLSTRNKMKSKKPLFQSQDVNIFKQFEGKWRRPRGIHSKLRKGFRGHSASPSIGYGGPKDVRGLTRKGFVSVVVHNLNDLSKVKDEVVIVAHGVGNRKRIQILTEVKKRGLHVLGLKDVDSFLSKVNEKLNLKKKESETRKEVKKKKVEEAEKVKDTKQEKDEPKK